MHRVLLRHVTMQQSSTDSASGRHPSPRHTVLGGRRGSHPSTPAEAGRADRRAFTAVPIRPMAMRDDLLVKLRAVDIGHLEAVRAAVAERTDWARGKLARYEHLRERILAGRDEVDYLRQAERIGPYLTLLRGRMFKEDNIRWGEAVLKVLAERSSQLAAKSSG